MYHQASAPRPISPKRMATIRPKERRDAERVCAVGWAEWIFAGIISSAERAICCISEVESAEACSKRSKGEEG